MADAQGGDRNWWTTMPGILAAIAAIITAVGGLIAILSQTGFIGRTTAPATSPAAPGGAGVATTGATSAAATRDAASSPQPLPKTSVVVTHSDGSVVVLNPDAMVGDFGKLRLSNGQVVSREKVASLDIEQPFDGSATLVLVDGQRLSVRLSPGQTVEGKNELGPYYSSFNTLRRIEIRR